MAIVVCILYLILAQWHNWGSAVTKNEKWEKFFVAGKIKLSLSTSVYYSGRAFYYYISIFLMSLNFFFNDIKIN